HGEARGAFRAFAAALSVATLLAARAASAWTYPLLPHVNGLAFFPETPNNEQTTSILLSAVYPGECWRYVGGELRDSSYVHVTIERADTCSNDSLSYWTAGFEMGV